ncbi:Peptidoglycan/LPS O-acetylase OafA/YrhL, contains acyltransferase and SGNH-hydrolase domains [Pedobacter steynii]|uniref:Peptidoglycan/LPS O-acetylase OafA/YrhL, contains acyltransferase and SGNH-hydrolase domains n=1 Tax=Pedobacter steynii TaxID=430522 RepID=A0A1G9KK77_9SPHI|nr:acyltransferase [Pedobacter steynii]NQX38578.1 acyltransferase [Pedobacter steynii]SDL50198.1 Peptidoglycan/LPS O-acetylase OafA/YrhL, contains acyltransferase and SGNH-hydrolase domains [Pedobacter steynii]
MKERFVLIDFLKGYSIFTIVIFHILQYFSLPQPFDKAIFFGGTGIHTFFLVSGFGLALSSGNKEISYLNFLKKRFDKIYLPYILIVCLSAGLCLFLPLFDQPSWYAFLGHVFFYKMFDNDITISYGHQLWFISTIIQFYLVFPFLLKLLNRIPGKWFICIGFLISIFWSIFVFLMEKSDLRIWNSFFLQFMWEFMLGMAMARWKDKSFLNRKFNHLYLMLFTGLGLLTYAFLAFKGGQVGRLFNDIPALIGYTGLAVMVYNFRIKAVNDFFLFTGKISYALYLIHVLVITVGLYVIHALQLSVPLSALLFVCFILCYVFAYWYTNLINLIYRFNEKGNK